MKTENMSPQEWADWNMQQMAECLDSAPQQESATIQEMTRHLGTSGTHSTVNKAVIRNWKDELEAAQQRIAELEKLNGIDELEKINEGVSDEN